jgi:hypothetical protein
MKRPRIALIILIFLISAEIAAYFIVGRDFDRHSQQEFYYPEVEGKRGDELRGTLKYYIEDYKRPDDFPETEDGLRSLKKLFIYVWAIKPSSFEDVSIDPKCELYKKLKRYYPELERFEIGDYVSVDDIVNTIIDRKPSKLRFVILRISDAL